jgi:cytoskeletal protein CcmA (bactofilin family)
VWGGAGLEKIGGDAWAFAAHWTFAAQSDCASLSEYATVLDVMLGFANRSRSASPASSSRDGGADMSVLPRTATVEGMLRLGEVDLLVEGDVQGSITTDGTVYVAEGGSIHGNVAARSIQVAAGSSVEGIVRAEELRAGGDVDADIVVLESLALPKTGHVDGTVLLGQEASLTVELGGILNATVQDVGDAHALQGGQGDSSLADAGAIASRATDPPLPSEAPDGERCEASATDEEAPSAKNDAPRDSSSASEDASQSQQAPTDRTVDRSDKVGSGDESNDDEAPSEEEENYGFDW